eukprot:COSAG06_NODE_4706_length_4024_cov_2.305478_1_plen_43_part_00
MFWYHEMLTLTGWLVGNPIRRGVLHNYAQLVGCASEGANVGS